MVGCFVSMQDMFVPPAHMHLLRKSTLRTREVLFVGCPSIESDAADDLLLQKVPFSNCRAQNPQTRYPLVMQAGNSGKCSHLPFSLVGCVCVANCDYIVTNANK